MPNGGTSAPLPFSSAAFGSCCTYVVDVCEGGETLVNDTGGLTRWGISKRAHPDVDVLTLSREGAYRIYEERYWRQIQAEKLPRGLDLLVFDAAVNMGPITAVKFLQKVLKLTDDGIMGQRTLAAMRAFRPQCELRALYNEARMRAYFDLVRSKPIYQQYLYPWSCRLFRVADEAGRVGSPS